MEEIKINIDPFPMALTSASILSDEENFALILISGSQGRNYVLSPKHAKRLLLLLQQKISEYEIQFGELKTSLPVATPGQTADRKIGFSME